MEEGDACGGRGGGGRVALQFYKYAAVLTNTHPGNVHTVTPFSIPQENGECEDRDRERERDTERLGPGFSLLSLPIQRIFL